jgi:GTPase
VLDRLRRRERHSIVVSARSGLGFDELRLLIARELPRPSTLVEVLLPYDRGDLVSRLHDVGELLEQEHRPEGTWLRALVSARLAGELSAYRIPKAPLAASGTAPTG